MQNKDQENYSFKSLVKIMEKKKDIYNNNNCCENVKCYYNNKGENNYIGDLRR